MFQATVCAGNLPKTVFLILIVLWSPGKQAPLATRARQSRVIPCVNCTHKLALVVKLGSTCYRSHPPALVGRGRCLSCMGQALVRQCHICTCPLAPAGQWESAVNCSYLLGPSKAAGLWCNCVHLAASARWQEASPVARPTGLSKVVRKCHVCVSQSVLAG